MHSTIDRNRPAWVQHEHGDDWVAAAGARGTCVGPTDFEGKSVNIVTTSNGGAGAGAGAGAGTSAGGSVIRMGTGGRQHTDPTLYNGPLQPAPLPSLFESLVYVPVV